MTDIDRIIAGLSKWERFLLEWLSKEEHSSYGECQGRDLDAHDTHDEEFDDGTCWNCDGEGYVYGCSWDWQCDTWDEGEGSCLCSRRCEICNPVKLTHEQQAAQAALQQILRDALNEPLPNGGRG